MVRKENSVPISGNLSHYESHTSLLFACLERMKSVLRKVQVILLANHSALGTVGSIVHVKPGYMRHYLHPMKMAVYATEHNIKCILDGKHHSIDPISIQSGLVSPNVSLLEPHIRLSVVNPPKNDDSIEKSQQ
jgi:hypothetical protein